MLSDTKIKALKPSDKCTASRPDKHSDFDGLQLWVRHTGTKSWVSAYRYQKKQQNLTLGKYPIMTLAQARQANAEVKAILAAGINPKTEKKRKQNRESNNSFNEYALTWLAERKRHVKPRTYQQDHNRMHKDILPHSKSMGLEEITFEDCKHMADDIESRTNARGNSPREVTRRTIALLYNVLKRAKQERLIPHNPAEDLKELYPKGKTEHMKHVELAELPQLLRDIENYHGHEQTRLAMKFLAYSFCRTIELRMMKWEHIDLPNKLWRVDIDNLKVARRHIVQLSKQMIDVLAELKPITGHQDYVFYNPSTHKPYSEDFINNALDILGYKGKQTGHGFRHIASTNLNELGYMGDAIEKQLAHDKKNSIRAVYNHAQHLDERRKIMQVWADFLDMLRDEGQVVDFKTARQRIEESLEEADQTPLAEADSERLIEALLAKGVSREELARLIK